MDKETILDYVTETPGNTNRAVLGSMLDSMGGGGGVNPHMATLTIVGSSDTAVINLFSCFDESTGYFESKLEAPLIGSYVLPLYKAESSKGGEYFTEIHNNGDRLSMTSSGDITIEEMYDAEADVFSFYDVKITGDCTITLA